MTRFAKLSLMLCALALHGLACGGGGQKSPGSSVGGAAGAGGSVKGSGGNARAGGVGGSGGSVGASCSNSNPDSLAMGADGWVARTCNSRNIQGQWYCYTDGINPTSCDGGKSLFRANAMCLSGSTTLDSTYKAWGAGIGVGLNQDAPAAAKSAWNASSNGVLGFRVTISGILGGNSVRVGFLGQAAAGGNAPHVQFLASQIPPNGVLEVMLTDAQVPQGWAVPEAGTRVNPTSIYAIEVQIVGGQQASTYDLCVNNVTVLTSAGGTGGMGGGGGVGGKGGSGGRTDGSSAVGGRGGIDGGAGQDAGVDAPLLDTGTDGTRSEARPVDGGSTDGPQGFFPISPGPTLDLSYEHACAIWGKTLKCWGENQYGQLGYAGAGSSNLLPTEVAGEWIAVAVGGGMTCAIKTDNSLWCWGRNTAGSLGLGSTVASNRSTPGKVGDGYLRVAANGGNACAIKTDGTLWCWGQGFYGILGFCTNPGASYCTRPADTGRPIQIAAPDTFQDVRMSATVLAIHSTQINGSPSARLWGWGNNFSTYRYVAGPIKTSSTDTYGAAVTQAAPAYYHHLIRVGSTVKRVPGWSAPVADATAPTGVTDVGASQYTMCLVSNKDIYCRGNNLYGQLGNGDWLPNTGTYTVNVEEWTKVKGPGGNWVQVVVSPRSACARDGNDAIWCWGNNELGQLGDGTTVSRSVPSQVGQAPPPHTCSDGIANGTEEKIDCGGAECIACPTCNDAIKNQDESDADCGGDICTKRCTAGQGCRVGKDCGCTSTVAGTCEKACPSTTLVCTPWCEDRDGDGAGTGPGCSGTDCDDNDGKWTAGCKIRDLFKGVPGTKTLNATIEREDYECVVVFGAYCTAQNNPACSWNRTPTTTQLDLTLKADGSYTIEAPYMEMCAADYVGAMVDASGNPTGEGIATSYPVPMLSRFWYYAPRDFDKCRANVTTGADVPVQHQVSTSMYGDQIIINEWCHTQFAVVNPTTGNTQALFDDRRWTVKVSAP